MLGLSAWSSRDWTESESFHLFDAPVEVSAVDLDLASAYVQQHVFRTREDLIRDLRITQELANASLNLLCLQGRVLYEPDTERCTRCNSHAVLSGRSGARYRVTCVLDSGRIVSAFSSCPFFSRFHLTRGPCKHLLALRLNQTP